MSYEKLGTEIGQLVDVKQKAYGDSFGKAGAVLRILYPDGISHEQLDDALTVVRVVDKLFRIATDRDALGEDPWRDVAGYGLLAAARRNRPGDDALRYGADQDRCRIPSCLMCAPTTTSTRPFKYVDADHNDRCATYDFQPCDCGGWDRA